MAKFLNLVKKYKIALLVIFVTMLFVSLILLLNSNDVPPTPSASPVTSGGQTLVPTPSGQSGGPLAFVRKIPEEETISSPWSVEPITFIFNKNINPNAIEYTIEPQIETKIKFENTTPTQFSIIPLGGLAVGQKYTITVFSVEATTGEKLAEPIQTSITRVFNPQDFPDVQE